MQNDIETYKKQLTDISGALTFVTNYHNSDNVINLFQEYNDLNKKCKKFISADIRNKIEKTQQKIHFNDAVKELILYCLDNKMFRLDIHSSGFLWKKRTWYSVDKDMCDISKKQELVDNVARFLDKSFEYSELFDKKEWINFFNDEKEKNSIVMEYIIKTAPAIIDENKREFYEKKIYRFYYLYMLYNSNHNYNYHGSTTLPSDYWNLVDKVTKLAKKYKKKYPKFKIFDISHSDLW